MVTVTTPRPAAATTDSDVRPALRAGSAAYGIAGALVLSAAASSLLTIVVPGVLRGPAVMNGSARGTALVILLAGVPVLAGSLLLARRGSALCVLTWLGSAGFLLYNSLMFVFATPVNRLFPLYLVTLSLAAWAVGTLAWQADIGALAARFSPRVPVRGIAAYIWAVVALNSAAWLASILPALGDRGQPAYLHGTGMTTNIVYVQDLALWLPLMAVAGAWLWRRRPWGYLLAGAGLVMWVIESVTIAVDQWYGHAADPASAVASAALVPAFAAAALIGIAPVYYLLRGFRRGSRAGAFPVAGHRGWPAWLLAFVAATVAANAVLGGVGLLRDGYGMPLSWLSHSPLTSWTLPATALLTGVAVPQLMLLALIVAANRWALLAGYLAGLALVAWIAVQLLVLQRYFFLQPVIACLGGLEVLLARMWQRRNPEEGRWPSGGSSAQPPAR